MSISNIENICIENENRFVLYPIKYYDVWLMYKKQIASFWTVEEVDLSQDINCWNKLNKNEKYFIKHILGFFASADGIVIENLFINLINEIKIPEIKCFYSLQATMENIHSEMYSLLIDTYIQNENEKHKLFNSNIYYKCINDKNEWALKWIKKNTSFAKRLIAFACVEGIFFSGAFCSIFWLKKRGLMPGLTFSNELISKDEGLHTKFACLIYKQYCKNKLNKNEFEDIIKNAVQIEINFICKALSVNLIGMNSKLMIQYIQYVADNLCYSLGYDKIYNTKNPFDWMEMISLNGKTNFFDKRVSEYQKANVMNNVNKNINNFKFTLDEEF